jgi:hypothetical protein
MSSSQVFRKRAFADGVYKRLIADERLQVGIRRRAFADGCATTDC